MVECPYMGKYLMVCYYYNRFCYHNHDAVINDYCRIWLIAESVCVLKSAALLGSIYIQHIYVTYQLSQHCTCNPSYASDDLLRQQNRCHSNSLYVRAAIAAIVIAYMSLYKQ